MPTGTVCKIIQESELQDNLISYELWLQKAFTNPHLAALANDYAGRLLENINSGDDDAVQERSST